MEPPTAESERNDEGMSNRTNITDITEMGESRNISRRVSKDTWNAIEKKLSSFDLLVLGSLKEYVATNYATAVSVKSSTGKRRVIGDVYYTTIVRAWLIENKYVKPDDKKTKQSSQETASGKTMKKIDMIRHQNASRIVVECFAVVKRSVESQNEHSFQLAFKSDIIEFIAIAFMMQMTEIINNHKQYAEGQKYIETMSLMVSVQHFLAQCEQMTGSDVTSPQHQIEISATCISDLRNKYIEIERLFPFDGLKICEMAPQLLYWSLYDKYLPIQNIAIRPHQKEIIDQIAHHMISGFICSYRATIGSGKTTVVYAIAYYLAYLRETNAIYKDIQLLFACNMESVRNQVGQLCYENLPFGIARLDTTECGYKIVNNYNCRDKRRLVVIASPEIARLILLDESKKIVTTIAKEGINPKLVTNYLLFLDEPTTGADECDMSLQHNVRLMMNLPKWSILSSATLPPINTLKIVDIAREDNKFLEVIEITSNDIQIGCDMRTYDGRLFVPFSICKTQAELTSAIAMIKFTPFLGRCLTGEVAVKLWSLMNLKSIAGLPDLKSLFKDVNNMTASNVAKLVIDMLELLSQQPDNMIESICSAVVAETDETKTKQLDFTTLDTDDAWKYPGMTLIQTNDPLKFAQEHFCNILAELKTRGKISSASQILDQYTKESDRFKARVNSIVSTMKSELDDREKITKSGKTKSRNASEEEKSRRRAELENDAPPMGFPEWAQIGTIAHTIYYNPTMQISTHRDPIALELIYDDLVDLTVPDEAVRLLMCGVGIYQPCSKILGQDYFDLVLRMASDGILQYIVADNSISYGTNYPFAQVITCDDFAKTHSLNTIKQGIGRSGRYGKSWKGGCFIPENVVHRIHECLRKSEYYDTTEAININNMVEHIKQQSVSEIADEISRREKSIIEKEKQKEHSDVILVKYAKKSETSSESARSEDSQQKKTSKKKPKASAKPEPKSEPKEDFQQKTSKKKPKESAKPEPKSEPQPPQKSYVPPCRVRSEQAKQPEPKEFSRKTLFPFAPSEPSKASFVAEFSRKTVEPSAAHSLESTGKYIPKCTMKASFDTSKLDADKADTSDKFRWKR